MRIGSVQLVSPLVLAPLAGYTNLAFRMVVRPLGGLGLATTDLINARSLLEKRARAFKLIETTPADRPLAVQLFGSVPEEMRDAALVVESLGIDLVDINMGCPVRKVCQVGGGSAMLTDLDKTAALVKLMVNALKIPVTVKMRLGWDEQNLTAPELAKTLEDIGVAAITIHGRTREQGFGGVVSLPGIRAVVQAVKRIPIIGNGDVTTPASAKMMLDETGCAGVSIGRGAFYNPWIFRQTLHYLQTGAQLPEAAFEERIDVMCQHMDRMIEILGEEVGCRLFRKIAPWYARQFGPAKVFTKRAVQVSTRAEFHALLADYRQWRQQFLDDNGQLKPKFQPAPLTASFQPGGHHEAGIPLPHGPVEWW